MDWFRIPAKSGPSRPLVFNSFGELAKALSLPWVDPKIVPDLRPSWAEMSSQLPVGQEQPNPLLNIEPTAWSLATPSSSSPLLFKPGAATTLTEKENHNLELQCNFAPAIGGSPAAMAYERAGPKSFVPRTLV